MVDVDWHKLYKKAANDLQFYKYQYEAELEKRKKDESRAFLRGVYAACVTFLVVVGIVAACVR